LDVDGGVADDQGLVGRDSGFVQDGLRSLGVGFCGEAVASVDADEKWPRPRLAQYRAKVDGLVERTDIRRGAAFVGVGVGWGSVGRRQGREDFWIPS